MTLPGKFGAAVAIAGAIAGCAMLQPSTEGPVRHRYVVLGPDGVAMARAITTAERCPAIDIDGVVLLHHCPRQRMSEARITERAVAVGAVQAITLDQRVQPRVLQPRLQLLQLRPPLQPRLPLSRRLINTWRRKAARINRFIQAECRLRSTSTGKT